MLAAVVASAALSWAPTLLAPHHAPSLHTRHAPVTALAAKAKRKGGKKSPAAGGGGGGGFGQKAADVAAPAPTPAELLKKSMELYDEIKKDLRATVSDDDDADDTPVDPADDYSVTEYVVTVRLTADCASEAADAFSDWVPVCIMNLKSSNRADTRQLLPQAHLHLCTAWRRHPRCHQRRLLYHHLDHHHKLRHQRQHPQWQRWLQRQRQPRERSGGGDSSAATAAAAAAAPATAAPAAAAAATWREESPCGAVRRPPWARRSPPPPALFSIGPLLSGGWRLVQGDPRGGLPIGDGAAQGAAHVGGATRAREDGAAWGPRLLTPRAR